MDVLGTTSNHQKKITGKTTSITRASQKTKQPASVRLHGWCLSPWRTATTTQLELPGNPPQHWQSPAFLIILPRFWSCNNCHVGPWCRSHSTATGARLTTMAGRSFFSLGPVQICRTWTRGMSGENGGPEVSLKIILYVSLILSYVINCI